MNPKDAKAVLRRSLQSERASLEKEIVQRASGLIERHLLAWLSGRQYGAVAAYMAAHNEPTIHHAMDFDLAHGKRWYFPRILSDGDMEFVSWRSDEPLRRGRFGIFEPVDGQHLVFDCRDVLFLMPCVAIDQRGMRIGSGAGYYDRFLATIPDRSRIFCVAVCMDRFVLDYSFAAESHDIPVSAVITESGVRFFPG